MRILGEIPKNKKEIIRVCLADFKGKAFVHLRTCFEQDGSWLFTKKGISVRPEHLETVIELLNEALTLCRDDKSKGDGNV